MRAIFEHDFLRFARLPRFFVLRTVMVGVPVLFLALTPLMQRVGTGGDTVGRFIFWSTTIAVVSLVAIVTPGIVGGVLADERRDGRLDVLRSTVLSPAGLVLGVLSSRCALLGCMCIAAFPIAATALPFGGVSVGQFCAMTVAVLSSMAMIAAVAILASAATADPGVATRRAYLRTLVLLFGGRLITAAAGWLAGSTGAALPTAFTAVIDVIDPSPIAFFVALGNTPGLPGFAAAAFVLRASLVLGICLLLAIRAVTREPADRRESVGSPAPVLGESVRGFAQPAWADRFPWLWFEVTRTWGRLRRRLGNVLLAVGLIAVEIGFLATFFDWRAGLPHWNSTIENVILTPCLCLAVAFVVAGSAGALAFQRERANKTQDVLHACPISNGAIIWGKVAAALVPALPWWGLSCFHALVAVISTELMAVAFLSWILVSGMLMLALAAFALLVSDGAPNGRVAIVKTFTWMLVVCLLLPALNPSCFARGVFHGDGVAMFAGLNPMHLAGLSLALWAPSTLPRHPDALWGFLHVLNYSLFAWGGLTLELPERYGARRNVPGWRGPRHAR